MSQIPFQLINTILLVIITLTLLWNLRSLRYFIRSSKILRLLFKQTESMNRRLRTIYETQTIRKQDLEAILKTLDTLDQKLDQ